MSYPISNSARLIPIDQPLLKAEERKSFGSEHLSALFPFPIEAKRHIHDFFNKLPEFQLAPNQVKPLLNYTIENFNEYARKMHQDHLQIYQLVNPQATQSMFKEHKNNWLLVLKQRVKSEGLNLNIRKIREKLKEILPKKTYDTLDGIFKQQKKESNETVALINACFLMGENIHESLAKALTEYGYRGLLEYDYVSYASESAIPRKQYADAGIAHCASPASGLSKGPENAHQYRFFGGGEGGGGKESPSTIPQWFRSVRHGRMQSRNHEKSYPPDSDSLPYHSTAPTSPSKFVRRQAKASEKVIRLGNSIVGDGGLNKIKVDVAADESGSEAGFLASALPARMPLMNKPRLSDFPTIGNHFV